MCCSLLSHLMPAFSPSCSTTRICVYALFIYRVSSPCCEYRTVNIPVVLAAAGCQFTWAHKLWADWELISTTTLAQRFGVCFMHIFGQTKTIVQLNLFFFSLSLSLSKGSTGRMEQALFACLEEGIVPSRSHHNPWRPRGVTLGVTRALRCSGQAFHTHI